MTHIPLNTTAVTGKVAAALTGSSAPQTNPAHDLAAALAGDSAVDGTGFGLSPEHELIKAPATDPSQGRGNRRPRVTDDPIMNAFQRMGLA